MSLHSLERKQILGISLGEAWDFFSSPLNLDQITPPSMHFVIRSDFKKEDRINEGMLIHYTVSPLLGIPLKWTTKITEVDYPHHFADEQLKGPFSFWRHQHFFEAVEQGVKMTDMVVYVVPGWFLGDVVNTITVRKKVSAIFNYRAGVLEKLFPIK